MFFKHEDWHETKTFIDEHDLSTEDYRIFRLALALRQKHILRPAAIDLANDMLSLQTSYPPPAQLRTGESLSAVKRGLISRLVKHRREIAGIAKSIGDRPS